MTPSIRSFGRRDSLFLLSAAAGAVAFAGAAVVRCQGWAPDDFYITYRYAKNLASGNGLVYNLGERVFGTTDPGLGLTLALLHFLTRIPVEWLASVVFGGALAGAAVLLFKEGTSHSCRLEMAAGGLAVLLSSLIWAQNGAAAASTLVLLLGAASMAEDRPVTAGCLAGLAVWVRPDAGVGLAILLVLLLLETRRVPWRFALTAVMVVLAGLLCARAWFGSFLPNTLGAKLDMAAANPASATGFEGFWGRAAIPLDRHLGSAWLLLVVLGLIGQWPLFQRTGRLGRLLVLYAGALAVLYPVLGVPFFSWYILLPVIAMMFGITFFVGTAVRGLVERLGDSRWLQGTGVAAGLLILALLFKTLVLSATPWSFSPPERLMTYRIGAEWLRQNSEPTDSIAYVEIGVLGYYSERPLEDLMGLVTPRVLPYVAKNDILGAFLTKPTTFVISHSRGRMAPIVQAEWFPSVYQEVARFKDHDARGGTLVIYRRLREREPSPPRSAAEI